MNAAPTLLIQKATGGSRRIHPQIWKNHPIHNMQLQLFLQQLIRRHPQIHRQAPQIIWIENNRFSHSVAACRAPLTVTAASPHHIIFIIQPSVGNLLQAYISFHLSFPFSAAHSISIIAEIWTMLNNFQQPGHIFRRITYYHYTLFPFPFKGF